MCRLLAIKAKEKFSISRHLEVFAELAKNSKEYQGHGWGCAYVLDDGTWVYYRNIKPIWEDDFTQFKETNLLLVHARSAFQDKGIVIDNNMPFYDDKYIFIFNGELRGVRIKEEGRIGAEKIFNFIKRFDENGMQEAMEKGYRLIQKRSKYVRAMNTIITDREKLFVGSVFNEDPDYFTMWIKTTSNDTIVCTDPYPEEEGWEKIENGKVMVIE